tara:strand:- start:4143 stop:4475 length:333 start_codon:yes stop_codon:yes gene_type:complete
MRKKLHEAIERLGQSADLLIVTIMENVAREQKDAALKEFRDNLSDVRQLTDKYYDFDIMEEDTYANPRGSRTIQSADENIFLYMFSFYRNDDMAIDSVKEVMHGIDTAFN